MTVDEAVAADRKYFDEHPNEDEYVREFVPGEFAKAELPEIPEGFRYATHVESHATSRWRPDRTLSQSHDVCEGDELKRLVAS
jgi:hypothetical protein